ncbi:GntR family transcriptional regulator [Clostridium sp. Marseille-QA1073]
MINIDSRSNIPIYEQIVNGVKENIFKSILKPGDKLPSVREMASMITTNPNTVSKAYSELEREKIIETIRGKGTYVSLSYKPKIDEDKIKIIKENLKKTILEAHYMGMDKEAVIDMLENIYDEFRGDLNDRNK